MQLHRCTPEYFFVKIIRFLLLKPPPCPNYSQFEVDYLTVLWHFNVHLYTVGSSLHFCGVMFSLALVRAKENQKFFG
jgi:hypothetical protein